MPLDLNSPVSRRKVLKAAAGTTLTAALAPLIAACSGSTGSSPAASAARSAAPTGKAPSAGAPIAMWSNHPEWQQPLTSILAQYTKESGIPIQLVEKPGAQYIQDLNTAMQAGTAPDLPGVTPIPLLEQFYTNKNVIDLTGKVAVDNLLPVVKDRVVYNGHTLGVPFGRYIIGIYYQAETFSKLGLQKPNTWDEFKTLCSTLQKAGQVPLMMAAQDGTIPSFYYMLVTATVLGTSGFTDLLSGKRKFTDPDMVAAAQLLVDLAPYYQSGFAATPYANGKAEFARGKMAMAMGGSTDYVGFVGVNPNVNLGWFAFPPPSTTAGATATVSGLELTYAVNASSKHQNEAVNFVNWLTTPAASSLFAQSLTLPTVSGVAIGTKYPILKTEVAGEGDDLPVWRDLDATAPVWNYSVQNVQALLLNKMSAAQFAAGAQGALKL